MDQEEYNLNWHTFSDHLREMLHDMRNSNELTDVTLVCDDKRQFQAHKVVLSACSKVFKSIIHNLPQNSSVIYLRGIHHQEMESILEFMYLGKATFYEDRINEVMNVAKNLEIKEISNDMEFPDESELTYKVPETSNLKTEFTEQTNKRNTTNVSNRIVTGDNQNNKERLFECNQCENQYATKEGLTNHIRSKHEGVRHDCNQCEQQFTQQSALSTHIKSKHDGVRYPCNQCNYQAPRLDKLRNHIESKHEGVKYSCNVCNHETTTKHGLNLHILSKHEKN